jgi:gamma-glutamyltranspeptidase/glutathione hydrolase
MALGILDALQNNQQMPDLETLTPNSEVHLHNVIEALRIAFADTRFYVADSDVVNVPVAGLLDKVC